MQAETIKLIEPIKYKKRLFGTRISKGTIAHDIEKGSLEVPCSYHKNEFKSEHYEEDLKSLKDLYKSQRKLG